MKDSNNLKKLNDNDKKLLIGIKTLNKDLGNWNNLIEMSKIGLRKFNAINK